jgi:hypothetical protein
MLQTRCRYCQNPEMPEPPNNARPFGKCPACGLKSRAVIEWIEQGTKRQVRYVKTGKVSAGKVKIVPFRPTPENMRRLEQEINRSEAINRALEKYYNAV